MPKRLSLLIIAMCLTACVAPTLTGPASFANAPHSGWTKDEVRAHWGIPYSSSYYDGAHHTYDTWVYRRTYFVATHRGSVLESEWASVSKRVTTSYTLARN